jgi:hypothetical protein
VSLLLLPARACARVCVRRLFGWFQSRFLFRLFGQAGPPFSVLWAEADGRGGGS